MYSGMAIPSGRYRGIRHAIRPSRFVTKVAIIFVSLLLAISTFAVGADAPVPSEQAQTPPRLSFIDGQASFWRTGANDWAPARVNIPLAAGDRLYTADRSNLEIQVGPRAFVRTAARSEIGIVNLEPDFLQIELKSGTASLDLRSLPPAHTVELDTPNAVFTIENTGYYRANIEGDATHFITRRAGRALITVTDSAPQSVAPSEEIVVHGTTPATITTYVAPQLDGWDQWNYARTDQESEALSARYVSPGIYGAGTLDYYGTWRVVPSYGPVWIPQGLAPGWVPYSIGSWIWDPFYGWTWVDDAPWGWAPFHYGRWVFIDRFWGWAPGPLIVRPAYAPALVSFFGIAPGVSIRIGIGGTAISWVALGWGEPLRPWWGGPGFIGVPWWGGWGGPHIVNNVVIQQNSAVDVNRIVYQNTRISNALIAAGENQFGAGHIRGIHFTPRDPHELEPVGGTLPVRPRPASVAPVMGTAIGPPSDVASRPIIATRPPRQITVPWKTETPAAKSPLAAPAPQVVTPPKWPQSTTALPRPPFGDKGPERTRPPQPPHYQDLQKTPGALPSQPPGTLTQKPTLQRPSPRAPSYSPGVAPPAPRGRVEATPPEAARALPGRPANTLYPRGMGNVPSGPQRAAPTVPRR
ncbi:MAG TPA: DUF6600 domain-containing protein [Candidatus Binatia bacterium]|jgi:hypothetical protein